ncbi:hypothetical protein EG878_14850 [Enterococcus faecalis]|nr:hypothetical protein EG878_14850 [Enterococcus faecalis]
MILIHRLVLLHHGYNKHNKPNVNHIDGNKANNHISNLEWVTHKENMEHANRLGLIKHNPPKGERAGSAKFSNEDAIKISEMLDQGVSTKEIAKIYGVSTMTILRLKKGDTWSSVTGRGQ